MSSTVPGREQEWISLVPRLRLWFCIFLAAWLGGAASFILGFVLVESNTRQAYVGQYIQQVRSPGAATGEILAIIGMVLFFSSVVPYLLSMGLAYKIQAGLKAAGHIKSNAWQIVIAGLILNPYVVGFYPLASVLSAATEAQKSGGGI